MNLQKWLKPNIFSKLILSFLVVLIPIYGLSIYAIQSAEENVRDQLSQSVVSNVNFYMSSFENEMQRIMQLNKELIFDDDFQKIRTIADAMDDYTRAQTILSVKKKLQLLKTSSLYVENVKVYIPSLDRGIFANNYENEFPQDELDALMESGRVGSPLTYWKNGLFLSDMYPKPYLQKLHPTIALGVDLSTPKLQSSLHRIIDMNGAGAALINIGQNWSFSDGKSDFILSKLRVFLSAQVQKDSVSDQGSLTVNGKKYSITFTYSKLLQTYLAVYIPESQLLGPLDKYRKILWLLSILSSIVIVIFSYWIYRLIHQPLKRLISSFRQVERGNLQVEIHHNFNDEFKYLYGQFNQMVAHLNRLIGEVYEERIYSQQAELKQLQSQINPHFLYNSFFILQGLIRMRDSETSEKLIQHLGEYFKFITRTGADTVTLEQEVGHSKAYTEIQTLRFCNLIEVKWGELPRSHCHMQVPRLILQPLIENAYIHGLEDKIADGKLTIQFQVEQDYLRVIVEDNGENLSNERLIELKEMLQSPKIYKESTGLFNVHRRLQLRYGEAFGLIVTRGALGGLYVVMRLPCKEG